MPGRHGPITALALIAVILVAVLLLSEQIAPRGRTLESIFEDDQLLVDQPLTTAGTARVAATLATLKSLGVDRIRLIVLWNQVAIDAGSRRAPWVSKPPTRRTTAAAGRPMTGSTRPPRWMAGLRIAVAPALSRWTSEAEAGSMRPAVASVRGWQTVARAANARS